MMINKRYSIFPTSKNSGSCLFLDFLNKTFPKSKRSQAWGMDLIIAVMLFLMGMIVFMIYTINSSSESNEEIAQLSLEGELIMTNILSEGYPDDWNSSNVVNIGIIDNEKINQTKLERFYDLSISNYGKTKSIFDTEYDYFFVVDNMTIRGLGVGGIGKPGTDIDNLNTSSLLKISRLTLYNYKVKNSYLYIWKE
ncbi:MAG: hypothetical protein Q8N99_01625 [Nanoarchaeota archaeon]|nr:hypothetical protein [Nanoarchaeota archaeon]